MSSSAMHHSQYFYLVNLKKNCNNKGEEITCCFIAENNLVVDYPNFEALFSSTEYLHAYP